MPFRLQAVRRVAVLALVLSLFVTLLPAPSAQALTANEIRNRIYRRINNARENHGLRRLKVNDTVQKWSQDHAGDMARAGDYYHDSALTVELNKLTRIVWWYGENVGMTSTGGNAPKRMHRAFMKSPGHRANILERSTTHMGLGVVKRDGMIYVVERFVDLRP
jgi:uncharacterized protein YkwD